MPRRCAAGSAPPRRIWGPRGSGGSELVGALGHGGLLVGGLVGVDDALAGGLVELLAGVAEKLDRLVLVAGLGGLAELADRGLHRGLDGLVAQAALLVRLDPLDLGLDVGHAKYSSVSITEASCRICAGPATGSTGSRASSRSECRTARPSQDNQPYGI